MSRKKIISATISIIIAAVFLWYLNSLADFSSVYSRLKSSNHSLLGTCLAAALFLPLFASLRWFGLINILTESKISYFECLRATFLVTTINAFVPAKLGETAKLAYFRKDLSLIERVATIAFERAIDIFVLGIMSLAGYFLTHNTLALIVGGTILGVEIVGFFLIQLLAPKTSKVRVIYMQIRQKLSVSEHGLKFVFLSLLSSLCFWMISAMIIVTVSVSIDAPLDLGSVLAVLPASIFIGLIPISVSGLGVRDTAMAHFFSTSIELHSAVTVSLSYTLIVIFWVAIFCFPIALLEAIKLRQTWTSDKEAISRTQPSIEKRQI